MPQQCGKRLLVGCAILPASEVANVALAQTFGPESIVLECTVIQTNGEEYLLSTNNLFVQSGLKFLLNPEALDGVEGEDK